MKQFLLKKMMEQQLKGIPEEQKEKLFSFIEKNPELVMELATSVQEKMKSGMDQMSAIQSVLDEHKDKLDGVM